MRSRYSSQTGTETFYNEVDNDFSGGNTQMQGTNPAVLNDAAPDTYVSGVAMQTSSAEALGDSANKLFRRNGILNREADCYCKSRSSESRVHYGTRTRLESNSRS